MRLRERKLVASSLDSVRFFLSDIHTHTRLFLTLVSLSWLIQDNNHSDTAAGKFESN